MARTWANRCWDAKPTTRLPMDDPGAWPPDSRGKEPRSPWKRRPSAVAATVAFEPSDRIRGVMADPVQPNLDVLRRLVGVAEARGGRYDFVPFAAAASVIGWGAAARQAVAHAHQNGWLAVFGDLSDPIGFRLRPSAPMAEW